MLGIRPSFLKQHIGNNTLVCCKILVGLRYTSFFCWITNVPYMRGYAARYWTPALELNKNLSLSSQAQPFCPTTVDGFSNETDRWYRLRFRKKKKKLFWIRSHHLYFWLIRSSYVKKCQVCACLYIQNSCQHNFAENMSWEKAFKIVKGEIWRERRWL